jgi:hypothetical protein
MSHILNEKQKKVLVKKEHTNGEEVRANTHSKITIHEKVLFVKQVLLIFLCFFTLLYNVGCTHFGYIHFHNVGEGEAKTPQVRKK